MNTMTQSANLVQAVNRLEQELGDISQQQLEAVTTILRQFMAEVRGILKRGGSYFEQNTDSKRPCSTCAFNPATDHWKGFAATAYGLLVSVREPKPFMCHDNQPGWKDNLHDPKLLSMCGGFESIIKIDPHACYAAAYKAMQEIRKIVPHLVESSNGKKSGDA